MTRIFLLSFISFLLSAGLAKAEQNLEMHIIPRYTYVTASMDVSSTGTANYSGTDVGGEVMIKTITDSAVGSGRYGLGIVGGYAQRNLDNTAAVAPYSETLEGSVFNIGVRFYALNLYLGTGILYAPFIVNYNEGAATTKLNYTGFGARIEAGIDLVWRQTLVLAPKINYDFINADKGNSTDNNKLNDLGLSIGLGFRF